MRRLPLSLVSLVFLAVVATGCSSSSPPQQSAAQNAQQSAAVASLQAEASAAQQRSPLLAVLGDSFSKGVPAIGGVGDKGWPALLAGAENWQLLVEARAGNGYVSTTATQAFSALIKAVVPRAPQVVIIWSSGSDGPNTPDAVAPAAGSAYLALKTGLPAAKIVVIGPTPAGPRNATRQSQLRDVEKAAAAVVGVPFIDPLADGWFSDPTLLGADGVHPTDAGHAHIAQLLRADLDKLGILTAVNGTTSASATASSSPRATASASASAGATSSTSATVTSSAGG